MTENFQRLHSRIISQNYGAVQHVFDGSKYCETIKLSNCLADPDTDTWTWVQTSTKPDEIAGRGWFVAVNQPVAYSLPNFCSSRPSFVRSGAAGARCTDRVRPADPARWNRYVPSHRRKIPCRTWPVCLPSGVAARTGQSPPAWRGVPSHWSWENWADFPPGAAPWSASWSTAVCSTAGRTASGPCTASRSGHDVPLACRETDLHTNEPLSISSEF